MTDNKFYVVSLLLLIALSGCTSKDRSTQTVSDAQKIIFETDIGNDVDDALALDMLYKYMDAGDINLLGIMINKEGIYPPEYTDIMNTGMVTLKFLLVSYQWCGLRNDATIMPNVSLMNKENGEPIFHRSLKDYSTLPEAHILYRELAKQPDNSVTIISVGFSTNLAVYWILPE